MGKSVGKVVNGTTGVLITLNGIARLFKFGVSDGLAMFVMTLWLIIFGTLFILIELKLPRLESLFKANIEFMYLPGFRAFFLTFIGTMQWWWWLGILVSVICFLVAIFNSYVMKTHPAFGHSSNIDDCQPPAPPAP